jgi:exodeoxyribonuclease V beta subunit
MKTAKSRLRQLSYDDLLTTLNEALNGVSGAARGDALRQRFPVAMIDEFQDTDPVQYQIFSTLYRHQEDTSLVLIGDPKQAIYGFRGGDIFTYMRARSEVTDGTIYTLDTNWRSSPGVIGAVNALFGTRPENAFVYGDSILFSAASAAQKEHATLTRRGSEQTPLTLWTIPDDGKTLNKNQAGPHTHTAVADEIAHLINEGRAGTALLNGTPVLPRDIAVLVNNSYEAADLRRELNRRGVSSVSIQHDNVFETREAEELALLLEAIIEPRDRRLARRALSASLLGHDYLAINAIQHDEHLWSQLVDDLIDLSNTWQNKGFMPMFLQMMRQLQLSASIASGPQPERRLSNLLHLGELLQQASLEHSGMEALLNWLRAQRDVPAGNEAELRLESDEELVQLVTIHSSKGLQYPIVFVPYGWDCKTRDPNKGLLEFHRGPQHEACVDAGSPDLSAHLLLAEKERLAEDVRKIYVAVTRAESALYLVWGKAKDTAQTGLAWLLHPHQSVNDLAQTTPDAFAGLSSLQPDLEQLVQSADGQVRVSVLAQDSPPVVLPPQPRGGVITARQFDGFIGTDWRINSFSSMTRGRHAPPAAQRDVIEDDPAMQFPAGSSVGSYLHTLFEHIDFHGDIFTQVLQVSERFAPRYDIDHARWGEIAARWIQRVIDTPLDSDGLKLGELTNAQRLNEMEFDFSTCRIDSGHLDQLLSGDGQRPPLQLETFQGLVTGIIDLVFEHRGRYYVADY